MKVFRYESIDTIYFFIFQAQAPDDLSVRRGDWVYADLSNQTVVGWLWTYSPKTRKYGFIPKAYARPPAMTSLWTSLIKAFVNEKFKRISDRIQEEEQS